MPVYCVSDCDLHIQLLLYTSYGKEPSGAYTASGKGASAASGRGLHVTAPTTPTVKEGIP